MASPLELVVGPLLHVVGPQPYVMGVGKVKVGEHISLPRLRGALPL